MGEEIFYTMKRIRIEEYEDGVVTISYPVYCPNWLWWVFKRFSYEDL